VLKRSARNKREEKNTVLLRQTEKKFVAIKQFHLNFAPRKSVSKPGLSANEIRIRVGRTTSRHVETSVQASTVSDVEASTA
jgi:hypothetical protein